MKRQKKMCKDKIKEFAFLHIVLLFYSLISVISKDASKRDAIGFLIEYVIVLFMLFFYAILWQQVLKKMSLSFAFANKAVVIVWGFIWGYLIYGEKLQWIKIIGAGVIILGILCMVDDYGE